MIVGVAVAVLGVVGLVSLASQTWWVFIGLGLLVVAANVVSFYYLRWHEHCPHCEAWVRTSAAACRRCGRTL
jgi:hypothetical protein